MKRFHSEHEYQEMINRLRDEKPFLTNGMISSEKFHKLAGENRIFYDLADKGILVYVDNGEYYNIYYYLAEKRSIPVCPKDKPVVVKSMYLKSKENRQETINSILRNSGFIRKDTMGQITGKPEQILQTIKKPCEVAMRVLSKNGFKLKRLDADRLPGFFEMQRQAAQIPFYQFEYFSYKEYLQEIADGHIVCIVDDKDELCGIRHVFVENNSMYGWVAIKEAYQAEYGMALALSAYSLELARKNGWKAMGWVTNTNTVSARYHKRLGYSWTGRCMDEWVLERV